MVPHPTLWSHLVTKTESGVYNETGIGAYKSAFSWEQGGGILS